MPTLRQLEYLCALAETRHFRKASERCNTTQPTLSEQIKALEDRLGAQLVERNRSGALLTPIGAQVAEIGRRVLSDVSEIRLLASSGDVGLRALYFALAAVINRFTYLKQALALVLIFIGSKIFIADLMGWEKFPAGISLSVTLALIGAGVLYSLYKTRPPTVTVGR